MIPLTPLPPTEIQKLLENKAVVITVNQRLARYLTNRFNRQQADAGRAVWETPDVLPYNAWLGRIYDQARYLPDSDASGVQKMRLSPSQEGFVWERIIQDLSSGHSLLRVPETAQAAARAWELCQQWQLSIHELAQAPPEETIAFLGWAKAFEQQCRDNGWLDAARLADAVMPLFKSRHIPVPGQLILAGFDELSPQQISLIKSLKDLGCQVFEMSVPDALPNIQRCEMPDTQSEITAAAKWARDRLEENASARIGIIVQDLKALQSSVARIFDDVLHPSMVFSPKTGKQRVYNISLGSPLADYPVISTALKILNFAGRALSVDEYSLLLRSPFLGGAEGEIFKRAVLDARIRESGETALSVSDMIYFSDVHKGKALHPGIFCPELNKGLKDFKREIAELPKKQAPSGWGRDFHHLVYLMGWPKGRILSSEAFQAVNAWNDAIFEFAALDTVCKELDFHSAIRLLAQNIKTKIFQPETEDMPVQIMGMLEVVGERFDHIWIMGMDAESWPSTPRPNPFLPVWVQKKYNIPHASPDRELDYARQVTLRLLTSADSVMVSSPTKDGDTDLFPSPLIAHFEPIKINSDNENGWIQILDTADFEKIADQQGPAADEKSHISGGTGLLKAQAACPFSAFAAHRLFAKPLEIPESGLNARERGSLIHHALELFWEKIKTRDALKNLSDEMLAEAVAHAVEQAVDGMAKKHPRAFPSRMTALEKERLHSLINDFLSIDAKRTPFTVIGREEKLVCTIAGIELKTYADRIDRLDDGRLVIVDYKTGEPKVSDWFTDRLAEPQLPLYSVAVEKEVAGVVFGQIKKGKVQYLGVADAQIIPGARGPGAKGPLENFNTLNEIIDLWKGKIIFLADEVRQGVAAVAPVSVHKSCQYCDLGALCRIGEIDFF